MIDGYTAIVFVVGEQALKCTKHHRLPDTKITMGVGSPFLPHNDDIKIAGHSRQGVGKRGYILWQIDHMSAVCILSMG